MFELLQSDVYFVEKTSELESPKDSVMTVGRANYVRTFLVECQPSVEKVKALMEHHTNGIKMLCCIAQAVLSDVESWKSGIKAAKKAKEDERKAKEKERERQAKRRAMEEQKLAKKQKQQEDKARLAAEKAAKAAAEGQDGTDADGRRVRQRTNTAELNEETDWFVIYVERLLLGLFVEGGVVVEALQYTAHTKQTTHNMKHSTWNISKSTLTLTTPGLANHLEGTPL